MFKVRFWFAEIFLQEFLLYIFYDVTVGRTLSVDWNLQHLIQPVSFPCHYSCICSNLGWQRWSFCILNLLLSAGKVVIDSMKRLNWDLLHGWNKTSCDKKKKQSQWETAQSFIRLPFGSKASFQDKVGCQNLDVTKYSGFIQYLETNKQKGLPVTYAYWQKSVPWKHNLYFKC